MSRVQVATEKMRPVDHAWLRMDEPANLMMINGLLFFDRPLVLDEVKRALGERLLEIPRFQQRVVATTRGQRFSWEQDPTFDLDSHVVEETLASPGDDGALQNLVSHWMSTPLDRERPLWMCHLLQNYKGGCALLWRIHHCMGDGLALMLVLLSVTETEPPDPETAKEAVNPLRALFSANPPGKGGGPSLSRAGNASRGRAADGPGRKIGSSEQVDQAWGLYANFRPHGGAASGPANRVQGSFGYCEESDMDRAYLSG